MASTKHRNLFTTFLPLVSRLACLPSCCRHVCLVILVFLVSFQATNGQKPGNFKWDRSPKICSPIPAKYNNADAVLIKHQVTRYINYENGKYRYRESVKQRIKLITPAGVRQYTRIKTPLKEDAKIKMLDARTIKQSGEILHLTPKHIKTVNTTKVSTYREGAYCLFAIPGVEPGDEIETILTYDSENVHAGDVFFFHKELPTLAAIFKIETASKMDIALKEYHGLKEPIVTYRWETKEFCWTLNDLPALGDDQNAIPGLELPHLAYELDFRKLFEPVLITSQETWIDVLEHIHRKELQAKIRKPKLLTTLLNEIYNSQSGDTPIQQFQRFHEFVNREMTIRQISDQETAESMDYFLSIRQTDPVNLLRMYKYVFNDLEIPYFFAAGRERLDGPLDIEFPSALQIGQLLFVVLNKNGMAKLITPKTIDQTIPWQVIPSRLEGTKLFLYNPLDKQQLTTLEIPISPAQKNKMVHSYSIDLGSQDQQKDWKVVADYHGNTRSKLGIFNESCPNKKLKESRVRKNIEDNYFDAKLKQLKISTPADEKVQLEYVLQNVNAVNPLANDLWEISLKEMIVHDLPKIDTDRWLDYYPSNTYTDERNYELSFGQNIRMQGVEQKTWTKTTSYCTYKLTIEPTDQSIRIKSQFVLNTDRIPATDFHQLAEIEDMIHELSFIKLLIKSKNSIK